MTRRESRPQVSSHQRLESQRTTCIQCQQPMRVAYHAHHTITTLQGPCQLTLVVRRCQNTSCPWYRRTYRPEEEGRWALPHGEFGLDMIAFVGRLRYREHRSVPEIHGVLQERQICICERTVEHLLHRYDELVAVHLYDEERLRDILQGRNTPSWRWTVYSQM